MSATFSMADGLTAVSMGQLRCIDIEIEVQLVFHFDCAASNGNRLDAKVGLVQLELALVAVRTTCYFKTQFLGFSMEAQRTGDAVMRRSGLFDTRRLKMYLRILAGIEHLRAEHVGLNFSPRG